jgi:hypothetical protein
LEGKRGKTFKLNGKKMKKKIVANLEGQQRRERVQQEPEHELEHGQELKKNERKEREAKSK